MQKASGSFRRDVCVWLAMSSSAFLIRTRALCGAGSIWVFFRPGLREASQSESSVAHMLGVSEDRMGFQSKLRQRIKGLAEAMTSTPELGFFPWMRTSLRTHSLCGNAARCTQVTSGAGLTSLTGLLRFSPGFKCFCWELLTMVFCH